MPEKVCVFIGGKQIGVNCLRRLLEKGVKPALVVGNQDDDGTDGWHESLVRAAEENGLPVIKGRKVREPEVSEKITGQKPDVIFCVGGTQLIPKEVLGCTRLGCLNIHPAPLPKYRGRYSTVHAIFNGETETGVTAHWMDEDIDAGPIIFQEKMPIREDDTAKTLYDRFTVVGERLFQRFLRLWLAGEEIPSTPQDESQATYYPKGLPNGGRIDWSWPGHKIKDFIRAMTFEPFPPPDFAIGDKEMVIVDKKYFVGFGSGRKDE